MSSREIAELVESRHDKVKLSIERLAARGAIALPPMGEASFVGTDGRKQHTTEYHISKRDSYVLVAQLSPEFTGYLVDRWQELEERAAAPATVPQTYSSALRLAADLADQNAQLAATVAEQAPKVEALDRIATAEGALNLTAAAKTLQLGPIKFCESLRKMGWIYYRPGGKRNLGYQDKVQAGWLIHKVRRVVLPDGSEKIVEQVLVTPRGLAKLAILLDQTNGGAA
ncbi:phage antirepressor KilAC domain-containing protein [Noviherbaspirillum sp. Root189]|uniref:phage antirepressor KilAC domain-containing protein n=1 Tax=Noviherbaspirillum sp. Root189 TaxID=1736487 RepID=UPI00191077FF|nr:phage antirepressor KilAC domain-containing protein [Noviherbaspirillum sp. Root189]